MKNYKSTVDCAKRFNDRDEVESNYFLPEFGLPEDEVKFLDENGAILASGFERMVYGDGGPYIELRAEHINFETGFSRNPLQKDSRRYYDEFYSPTRSIMLYHQIKSVRDQPNPPNEFGKNRENGYADYREGRFYLDPFSPVLYIKYTFPLSHYEWMNEVRKARPIDSECAQESNSVRSLIGHLEEKLRLECPREASTFPEFKKEESDEFAIPADFAVKPKSSGKDDEKPPSGHVKAECASAIPVDRKEKFKSKREEEKEFADVHPFAIPAILYSKKPKRKARV